MPSLTMHPSILTLGDTAGQDLEYLKSNLGRNHGSHHRYRGGVNIDTQGQEVYYTQDYQVKIKEKSLKK